MSNGVTDQKHKARRFVERAFDVDRVSGRRPWQIRLRWLLGGLMCGIVGTAAFGHYQSVRLERDALRMVLEARGVAPDYNSIVSVITGVPGEHDPRSPVYQWAMENYQENLTKKILSSHGARPPAGHF